MRMRSCQSNVDREQLLVFSCGRVKACDELSHISIEPHHIYLALIFATGSWTTWTVSLAESCALCILGVLLMNSCADRVVGIMKWQCWSCLLLDYLTCLLLAYLIWLLSGSPELLFGLTLTLVTCSNLLAPSLVPSVFHQCLACSWSATCLCSTVQVKAALYFHLFLFLPFSLLMRTGHILFCQIFLNCHFVCHAIRHHFPIYLLPFTN